MAKKYLAGRKEGKINSAHFSGNFYFQLSTTAAYDKFIRQWIFLCEDKIERIKKTSSTSPPTPTPTPTVRSDPDEPASSADMVTTTQPSEKSDAEKASSDAGKASSVEAEISKGSEEALHSGTKVPESLPVQLEPQKGPKVSHDWYQTETSVVVEVRVKGIKTEDVSADISSTGLSLSIQLDSNRDYLLDLHLAHPIVPEKVSF